MHRLQRPKSPVDLNSIKNRHINWPDFAKNDRISHSSIANTLYSHMQQERCAYCECKIKDRHDGHIEHWKKRDDYAQLAFEWNNLFFSCNNRLTCGKHKDQKAGEIDYNILIDPAVDNPEDFLFFSQGGEIHPKNENSRATETIRVFNLNSPDLVQKRKSQWSSYKFLMEYSASDIDEYLDSLVDEPYITMLYHICGRTYPV